MTREEIISGLQMTMDLIQFDPGTGNVRPIYELNDLDKTTYLACKEAIEALKAQDVPDTNVGNKYEYHYDHTDCIWYRPEARNRCPVTCAQYRDGWNDAMNYIFRDGKGYMPYRRDKQYGE